MEVNEICITRGSDGRALISAELNGEELWFDIPVRDDLPETIADSFMIMALAGSMLKNEAIVVADKYPVSRTLHQNLFYIQSILSAWNPQFKRVEVRANTIDSSTRGTGIGSMYSGGIDSVHALLSRRGDVDEAIYIAGFDFEVSGGQAPSLSERNRDILQYFELPCRSISSNQQPWGTRTGVARNFWFSGYLAAAALLLGFERVHIPSSHGYADLSADGSHPVLDHFWSNGVTEFVHVDSEHPRSIKTQNVVSISALTPLLHVCWRYPDHNCGECEKCIRTMIALNAMDLEGPFPRKLSLSDIAHMQMGSKLSVGYTVDNIEFAHERGRHDLVKAMKKALRRYDRREALIHFDRGFLGSSVNKLRRRFRPYTTRVGFSNGRPDLDL